MIDEAWRKICHDPLFLEQWPKIMSEAGKLARGRKNPKASCLSLDWVLTNWTKIALNSCSWMLVDDKHKNEPPKPLSYEEVFGKALND